MADRFGGRQPVLHRDLNQHGFINPTDQIIRNQQNNNDDDDDDDVVVDEEEEELEDLECDLEGDSPAARILEHDENDETDEDDLRLLEAQVGSNDPGPEDLVSDMLANMAARFKNFEEILADLRLQLVEMHSRDNELMRRMAALNEQISEMHLIDVFAASGGVHVSSTLVNNNFGEAFGDLHMNDIVHGGSSHLKAASKSGGAGLGKQMFHK